jgi:hypothetical protein
MKRLHGEFGKRRSGLPDAVRGELGEEYIAVPD